MEVKFLRKLFDDGLLSKAYIYPAPMLDEQYYLACSKISGSEEQVSRTRDGKLKTYKRISGALIDAQEIGFSEVLIKMR